MNMSPIINELVTALAKAQGQIRPALKDKKNPFFKTFYADLASVWDACRSALSANGLAVIQTIESRDGCPVLITTLAHSSGQWMRSDMPIITKNMDPQGLGSAITYYRRYSLSAIVGVCPEDDDGEIAQTEKIEPRVNPKHSVEVRAKPYAVKVDKFTEVSSQHDQLLNHLRKDNIATEHLNQYLVDLAAKKNQSIEQVINSALDEVILPKFKEHYIKSLAKVNELADVAI